MIRDRKAMLSTLDAVLFVTILAVAAGCMFAVEEPDQAGPDASAICTDLFDVRLPVSLFVEHGGDTVYDLKDLTAIAMSSGSTGYLEDYMHRALSGALGGRFGYSLEMTLGEFTEKVSGGSGKAVSSFTAVYDVMGYRDLSVTLSILV